jgi:hypothetical protein
MKVQWIKTITVMGELDIDSNLPEEVQKQMAKDHAAVNGPIDLEGSAEWTGTQFFSEKPQFNGQFSYLEDTTTKYYEWFEETP